MLVDDIATPSGNPVKKLIGYFYNRTDVSFMYVLYIMETRFVTYCKDITKKKDYESTNDNFIVVYKKEVKA